MADFSESDYGMLYYSQGYYSYWPVELFASTVRVQFDAKAPLHNFLGFGVTVANIPIDTWDRLVVYAFRKFAADVRFSFDVDEHFGVDRGMREIKIRIPFDVDSNEYIGPFWIDWIGDRPPEIPWTPDIPAGGGWVPIQVSGSWTPDVPVSGGWVEHTGNFGPWIPIGPDIKPNPGY